LDGGRSDHGVIWERNCNGNPTGASPEAEMAVQLHKERKQDWRPIRKWWIGFDRKGKVFGHIAEYDTLPEHPPSTPGPAQPKP
jgi:hypothetical protein